MKNILRSFILISATVFLLFGAGCKKSNPSIIGTWKFSDVLSHSVGTQTNGGSTVTITQGISYSSALTTITQTTDTTGVIGAGSHSINLNSYLLSVKINADGTYLITESYTHNGVPAATSTTGTWLFESNSSSNDNISFTNGGSVLLNGNTFAGDNDAFGFSRKRYAITSLSSNQLILNFNDTNTSSSADASSSLTSSASITFTR